VKVASGTQVAAVTREVRERVTIALMRSLADQLAAAIVGSPHKALTKTNRYTHSAAALVESGSSRRTTVLETKPGTDHSL
jgi:hypothetical protein